MHAEYAGLVALALGCRVAVLIGDERQLPPPSLLPVRDAPRSLFSALKGKTRRVARITSRYFSALQKETLARDVVSALAMQRRPAHASSSTASSESLLS